MLYPELPQSQRRSEMVWWNRHWFTKSYVSICDTLYGLFFSRCINVLQLWLCRKRSTQYSIPYSHCTRFPHWDVFIAAKMSRGKMWPPIIPISTSQCYVIKTDATSIVQIMAQFWHIIACSQGYIGLFRFSITKRNRLAKWLIDKNKQRYTFPQIICH